MAAICDSPRFGTTRFGPHDHVMEDSQWRQDRLADTANPLGGGTVFTSFGFKGRTREWEVILTQAVRDDLNTQYQANTVATLTDEEGNTASALIQEFVPGGRVRMLSTRSMYRYRIVWLER